MNKKKKHCEIFWTESNKMNKTEVIDVCRQLEEDSILSDATGFFGIEDLDHLDEDIDDLEYEDWIGALLLLRGNCGCIDWRPNFITGIDTQFSFKSEASWDSFLNRKN